MGIIGMFIVFGIIECIIPKQLRFVTGLGFLGILWLFAAL